MQFIHSALLQAAQAAFAGKLGGAATHSQWNGLRVQRFVAALADLQQDVAHHAALQQRADAFLCAGLFSFVLDGGNRAHGGASLQSMTI